MALSRTLHRDTHDAPARETQTRWSFAIGPGMVVGAVATVALVVSMFMSWQTGDVHPSGIPAEFLWDRNATGDPSFLVYLVPLAVLLGVGSLMRGGAGLRIMAGLLTLVVVGVYAYQLHEVTDALGVGFTDTVETGFYVAAISGLVGLVSGLVPTRVPSRRVERTDVTG